jgi:hypothetical protein
MSCSWTVVARLLTTGSTTQAIIVALSKYGILVVITLCVQLDAALSLCIKACIGICADLSAGIYAG